MSLASRVLTAACIGLALGVGLTMAGAVQAGKPADPTSPAPPAQAAPPAASAVETSSIARSEHLSWEDARLLAEVLQRVRENYVKPVDDATLMQQAAQGLVEGLDEYSSFLDRDAYQELKLSTSGAYAGIGIEVDVRADRVVIVRCVPGSPAERAGLHGGDVIHSIDDQPVAARNFDVAIDAMRGEPDTLVKVAVTRAGKPLDFHIRRSRVELESVAAELLATGFGYLRISSFTDTTAPEFEAALQKLRGANRAALKGLVIDLRNNPGGVLDAAVAVADDLLDHGRIVSADGRTAEARFVSDATPGDLSEGAAIALLVNGGSASAAEILAAALQDNARGTLIGRKTYGKGSVQTIMPLSGGRALKLTTSHYFTPRGISLDHRGLDPDVTLDGVEQAAADLDPPGAPPTLAARDLAVGVALQTLRRTRVASGNSNSAPRS
jgi:carboxyl-terminal processing protease